MFRDEVKAARLVANPGCYPTSVQLPLMPLLKVHCTFFTIFKALKRCRVQENHMHVESNAIFATFKT